MMRYVLIGNYGVGNLGDEALKDFFLTEFPDIEWKVVSACPEQGEFPRLPAGVRSLFTPWWRTIGVIRKSDGVVFGGGSLFTDTESLYACFIWWWHARVARLFGKKIILAFQGIGPFRTRAGERLARATVRTASHVSVRDKGSYDRVKSWVAPASRSPKGEGSNKKVVQTFDPIFALIQNKKSELSTQKLLVVIPRMNSDDKFRERVRSMIGEGSWDAVRILSFQSGNTAERMVCMDIRKKCDVPAEVVAISTLVQLVREVGGATRVLAQRYHGALAALALKKDLEIVPQGEGDKLSSLLGIQNPDELIALVNRGVEALRNALRKA